MQPASPYIDPVNESQIFDKDLAHFMNPYEDPSSNSKQEVKYKPVLLSTVRENLTGESNYSSTHLSQKHNRNLKKSPSSAYSSHKGDQTSLTHKEMIKKEIKNVDSSLSPINSFCPSSLMGRSSSSAALKNNGGSGSKKQRQNASFLSTTSRNHGKIQ